MALVALTYSSIQTVRGDEAAARVRNSRHECSVVAFATGNKKKRRSAQVCSLG